MMQYYFKSVGLNKTPVNLNLSGFRGRSTNKRKGLGRLNASVLWLKYVEKHADKIYISIDTLYIPLEISNPVYEYLSKNYQLFPCQIVFNASHTHSAPALEKSFTINEYVDSDYVEYVLDKLLGLFGSIHLTDFANVDICLKQIPVPSSLTISRRKVGFDIRSFYLKRKTIMLPNSNKKIDDKIRLIIIRDEQRKVDVVLYNFSCHPVFDDGEQVSSDFIGVVNKYLAEKEGIHGMFLQGFLGDIRPNFTTRNFLEVNFINKTKILMNGLVFKPFVKSEFDAFCSQIGEVVTESCREIMESNTVANSGSVTQKEYPLVSDSGKVMKKLIVKMHLIDHALLISMPAEVTSSYYVELAKLFPRLLIIPLAVADGILGYLPFYKEALEGGYEVNSAANYGWDSKISYNSLKVFFEAMCLDISLEQEKLDE